MQKKQLISELSPGDVVDGLFAVATVQQGQARNGLYWRLDLSDSTGSMEAKIWSPLSQQVGEIKTGQLVDVQGRVVVFRDKSEIAVDALRILTEEEMLNVDLADFTRASEYDSESMLSELEAICKVTFTYAPWKKFYKLILRDEEIVRKLKLASAAKSMHHAYAGGLLEHSLGVVRLCMSLCDLYPQLDRQMLLAGAMCHDLGKIWELSSGLSVDYTGMGKLMGHISIGLEKMEPFLRKSGLDEDLAEHFKHLILSHHGRREFGSPCLPSTAEAMALHYADNVDAKMNQIKHALAQLPEEGGDWTGHIYGLDTSLFRARRSPEPENNKSTKGNKPVQESQCLLLLKE